MLGRHIQYGKYVLVHKWHVFRAGCGLGIPFLAALHDNSKFMPDEWRWYARHFYTESGEKRTRLNSDGFYRDVPDDTKFDRAWLKHIRRNKHHPQHWVEVSDVRCDCWDRFSPYRPNPYALLQDEGDVRCMACLISVPRESIRVIPQEMPDRYRREMLADWIGAGMAQGTPDTLGWYAARGKNHVFGPETRAWIEAMLGYTEVPA
jgi:hypothetical protein